MIIWKGSIKSFNKPDYHYIFDKATGRFAAWGKTIHDDPEFCKYGPDIFDCEITTICRGISGTPCNFCYKANTPNGKNMSFETFKMVFDSLPETICQIAFGADATLTANPDLWKMMDYCIENNVVPNITAANISKEVAEKLAERCGATAISYYGNWPIFCQSVMNLKEAGQKNINCHVMVSKETLSWIKEIYENPTFDVIRFLGAVVLLSLKKCGRGKGFTSVSRYEFDHIIDRFINAEIPFGADSCSAHKMIQAFADLEKPLMIESVIPCESSLQSIYCSVDGIFYPCSFNEKEEFGVQCTNTTNFIDDVWNSKQFEKFRTELLKNKRKCPSYNI